MDSSGRDGRVTLGTARRLAGAPGDQPLATPNYSYEKRQRELAKKRKAEEKRQRKLNGKPADDGSAEATPDDAEPPTDEAGPTEPQT